ncbi:hypothetical protein HDV57DRAFT_26463 [Trichoderma longibrachiatum]
MGVAPLMSDAALLLSMILDVAYQINQAGIIACCSALFTQVAKHHPQSHRTKSSAEMASRGRDPVSRQCSALERRQSPTFRPTIRPFDPDDPLARIGSISKDGALSCG